MKVAVIGCGTMGTVHARDLYKLPGIELTGVCDLDLKTAQSLAEGTAAQAFASFEEMMAEVEADVIHVCLPTYLHKEYVLKAADLGKHVICEKPIALNLADAEEMIAHCESRGVRLFVGHVVRFFPEYADLHTKIEAGVIGEPGIAHFKRIGSHPGMAKAWYNDEEKSGGILMDLMVHDIDFARWSFGEVKEVYAMSHRSQGKEYALVTLRFVNGTIANLEAHWGYPGAFTTSTEISGSAGILRSNSRDSGSLQLVRSTISRSALAGVQVPGSPSYHDPYYYELEHFLASIRNNNQSVVTARDAYHAIEIALAAKESARSGRPVQIASKGGVPV
ncbi:Gfo/Idh/MocA family protein [Paenibacillus lutrae]|uniref:Gfo/Idh/MocA family oxidoreductase n=1 Tax=Paenibacillus lutrae TaxID=2078573 RepID=A0A7X3JZI1_9BACL|nr:Gfo/Idh/MocA family oxidoreductase [Paenibacillus lutrae]MVP00204.1 gfo/Idh/MocA family oxidoreductase [Paenibacillus lutrae]